jgi:hypothetical protein
MSLILLFTGLAGFLASVTLLRLDISQMWIRHPVAVLIAYGVFLVLLRLWLWSNGRESKREIDDVDLEVPLEMIDGEVRYPHSLHYSGSEDLCTGGANAAANSVSSGFDFDLDFDGLVFLVVVLLLLVALLIPVLYVIYIAPVFLAEILVDGVLLVGLYKKVKKVDHPHWLRAAVRRTAIPALSVAVLFSIAGFAMQKAVPAAHSIGDVWRSLT